jgi:hypothetical protein
VQTTWLTNVPCAVGYRARSCEVQRTWVTRPEVPARRDKGRGVPASELADAHIDLESVWGRTAAELRERLCTATEMVSR